MWAMMNVVAWCTGSLERRTAAWLLTRDQGEEEREAIGCPSQSARFPVWLRCVNHGERFISRIVPLTAQQSRHAKGYVCIGLGKSNVSLQGTRHRPRDQAAGKKPKAAFTRSSVAVATAAARSLPSRSTSLR